MPLKTCMVKAAGRRGACRVSGIPNGMHFKRGEF